MTRTNRSTSLRTPQAIRSASSSPDRVDCGAAQRTDLPWSGIVRLEGPRGLLDPGAVARPPRRGVLGQVRVVGRHADCAVKTFAEDVGVPGVPIRLREHMYQQSVQRHVGPGPPGHPAWRVEAEGIDRRVGVLPDPPVAVDDLGARLVLGRPTVSVGFGVVVPPGQVFGEWTPEAFAEVPGLDN